MVSNSGGHATYRRQSSRLLACGRVQDLTAAGDVFMWAIVEMQWFDYH